MYQAVINPVHNRNLFSRHYLDSLINRNPEWERDDHVTPFNEIKQKFAEEAPFLEQYNEKQLEDHFFKPIFKILGFEYEVTAITGFGEFPDFAFFADRDSLGDAHHNKGKLSFFSNSLAIGEVKRWATDLDRFGRDKYNRNTNPSLQLWMYLHDTEPKWGILSNGALWRLYCKERRRDEYFEVNLPSIIISNDLEAFKFFYYFFRKEAFIPTRYGDPFLDRVIKGSAEYAQEIGEDLKKNVYRAMQRVAEGFIDWKQNQLNPLDPAALHLVQKNTMILLYRFLFLLYAEGKGLLDLDNPTYRETYSFSRLKKEVKEKTEGPIPLRYLPSTRSLYTSLRDLFQLIDEGSVSIGIPKDLFHNPAYNGGLFDPQKHPELEEWRIGDSYLAEAIDLLSRSKPNEGSRDFVDYSTLEIRHLGSIYEGLLEYRLQLAESDLVASDGCWVTLEEYNKGKKKEKGFTEFDENDRVSTGHLFLVTDKGERKSSGSYYTPDYIVNYIVKSTIDPIVEERWHEALDKNGSYVAATLSIKVLDPAMGSGHFLVGAVDHLAQNLLEAVQKDLHNGAISDASTCTTEWARREIVSHCIYGVDLNELAVELAKVGLWLTTISKDKPLSFLDHRLKQGNSLIGAKITDLAWYHEGDLQSTPKPSQRPIISPAIVKKILNKINTIEQTGDDNLDDIKTKEKLFQELQNLPEYQKAMQIADLNTSFYFGNRIEKTDYRIPASYYYDLLGSLYGNDAEWKTRTRYQWFKKATTMGKEKSFFHWELEFPEVFFDSGKVRDNPGWDAVIGNPPYANAWAMTSLDDTTREIIAAISPHKEFFSGHWDLYVPFVAMAAHLMRSGGYHSYILPDSVGREKYASPLRVSFVHNFTLTRWTHFEEENVFDDVSRHCAIYVIQKKRPASDGEVTCDKPPRPNEPPQTLFSVPLAKWLVGPTNQFRPKSVMGKSAEIIEKIESDSVYLGQYCYVMVGATVHSKDKTSFKKADVVTRSPKGNAKRFFDGGTLHRYEINYDGRFLDYQPDLMYGPRVPELFESPKILVRDVTDKNERLIVAFDADGFYCDHLVTCVTPYANVEGTNVQTEFEGYPRLEKDIPHLFYTLAVTASSLMSWYFKEIFATGTLQGSYSHTYPKQVRAFPIHKISFTTPSNRRGSLVTEAKNLYHDFTQNEVLEPLLDFINVCLSERQAGTDVVHDVLTFLAERMVDTHNQKNAEIRAFLEFIESEIGVPIESLSNKTLLKEYYATDFANFTAVLVKNRKNLKAGYNPTSRASRETLKCEYEISVAKLKPLITTIDATDQLIDQIVYRLYGLTQEEIGVIEGRSVTESVAPK